ncbi:MAG: FtsX-like permease family protein [Pedobacter sp.]|nr:MAG: FtsX-like permease family protein [Pedobacter sp.]
MFKLNLKIALRNLWKFKGYTFINIAGLSIGMASCILIFLFVRFQLSYDEDPPKKDRIHRVVTNWKYNSFEDFSAGVPIPVVKVIKDEIPGIEKSAAIMRTGATIRVKDEAGKDIVKNRKAIFYTEPAFFDMFDIKWLIGKPEEALKAPKMVALSEKTAINFFGSNENAIGKTIILGTKTLLKVSGVFEDLPKNSSFPLGIVVSYETNPEKDDDCWDCTSSSDELYVLLKEGLNAEDLAGAVASFNKRRYESKGISGNQNNQLQPLRDIHFSENYDNFAQNTISKTEIYGLLIIGLFLMITACINFINLSTAQAIRRSKEVGVRKVMGGKRNQLFFQFLSETLIVTCAAMLIACVLAELAIPYMENLLGGELSFSLFAHPVIFIFIGGLILFVAFLAGFYPAIIISGFNPALAIKNKVVLKGSGLSLRKVLVVVQFAISIILIISTIVVVGQMEFMQNKSLGFDPHNVAMVGMPNDSLSRTRHQGFKERLLKIPGVKMASFCQDAPSSENINSTDFSFNGIKNDDFELRSLRVDENYFKLFDLKLVAGKVFTKSDTVNGFVVNESFLKRVYIDNPQEAIGKSITAHGSTLPIVGVVKDFNDRSLKASISGLAISTGRNSTGNIAIKMDEKYLGSALKEIEALWNSLFPNHVYQASQLTDSLKGFYDMERVMSTLFKVFAGVIIFISLIGLFGLMSFIATQRTKEMAIRKVLGATTFQLVRMLNGSFLWMVFIANLVAWPIAYLFVNNWLSGFAYRTDLNAWPFALAMCSSLLITLITVSVRSYRAALANAVDALKYE